MALKPFHIAPVKPRPHAPQPRPAARPRPGKPGPSARPGRPCKKND